MHSCKHSSTCSNVFIQSKWNKINLFVLLIFPFELNYGNKFSVSFSISDSNVYGSKSISDSNNNDSV